MDTCPYKGLPDRAWWRQSVGDLPSYKVDPMAGMPFRIAPSDRVATAGSCFAQHIAKRLPDLGLTYFVAEPGPVRLSDQERAERQYGTFSARYGNIYTTRQFLQTLQRAFGEFTPLNDHWICEDGGILDPFRPSVEPRGYSGLDELRWDRERHFAAVRDLVRQSDIFVFTMGLTEGWRDRRDGSVFPTCPGCGYGEFDPDCHEFVNFGIRDVLEDLEAISAFFGAQNPTLRMILTVSPVPLVATMSGEHVLSATTYSKSVLRVAAQEAMDAYENCWYFPSYEIITGPQARGLYFRDDLREVTVHGVDHVMRVFANAFCSPEVAATQTEPRTRTGTAAPVTARDQENLIARVICDEEVLAQRYADS